MARGLMIAVAAPAPAVAVVGYLVYQFVRMITA
jgi:hypothetical protein